MSVSFRKAVEADVDALFPFIRQLHAQDRIVADETVLRSVLTGPIGDESRGIVWVIRDGETAAGYAVVTYGYSLEFHGRDAFLDGLFMRYLRTKRIHE
jgi:hypothetical protein